MMRALALGLLLTLGVGGANADLISHFRGHPRSSGGSSSACDSNPTNVCAQFQNGQTFVTWPDILSAGLEDDTHRYRVYRSSSPITSGNYTSATLVAKYIPNNSGQLIGGAPNASAGASYTQANRQSNAQPMAVLSDLGTALTYGSGLQVYTALGTQSAYYAVVATDTSDGTPSYIGSVGPIAESVQTTKPIKYADTSRNATDQITYSGGVPSSSVGKPFVMFLHASSSTGGCASASINCQYGDYWEWFGKSDESWQDGIMKTIDVRQDGPTGGVTYKSTGTGNNAIILSPRDTVWNTRVEGTLETYWLGLGLNLDGTHSYLYPTTTNSINRMVGWAAGFYGVDMNQTHCVGTSMGAYGCALWGVRAATYPFAAIWATYPIFRYDQKPPANWPGNSWPSGSSPFMATIAACNACLGTDASAVLMADGTTHFGGTGGYADIPTYVQASPGADLPFMAWTIGHDDQNFTATLTFQQEIDAVNALQAAHRGHAFVFVTGNHDMSGMATIDADASGALTAYAYRKDQFKLNLPYIAFDHSSIDDNMGTATRDANGIVDGDKVGCINCGFTWNVSSDTVGGVTFTVGNGFMNQNPTVHAQGTLAVSGALTTGTGTGPQTLPTPGNNGGVWNSTATGLNEYFQIGTEIVKGTISGTTLSITGRGQLGTTAATHSTGDAITQYTTVPTGPNGGPYATMTANVTPRRLQNFKPSNGTVLTCTVSTGATQHPTVTNGLITLTGVTINSGASTTISCS